VFTGPVLSKTDPLFVTAIKDQKISIPTIFWKVVIYPKENGKLHRVGFMMSQKKLLTENGIVEDLERAIPSAEDETFMHFEDAATYQVNIPLIEQLTELKMPEAIDSYKDNRSTKLVLDEIDIDIDNKLRSRSIEKPLGFSISKFVL
jgi:endonuclease G